MTVYWINVGRGQRTAFIAAAYSWFGLIPTPRWLDDNDHQIVAKYPRLGRALEAIFARLRAWRVIRLTSWPRDRAPHRG